MTDSDLLSEIADGHLDALRRLHESYAGWLAARLYKRCSDQTIVDEAVQDTFLAVWRSAASYRHDGDVAAWLWRIGIRKLIDLIRRQRHPIFERPEVEQSAEDMVLAAIGYGYLEPVLNNLSPELMAVVQARILDGLTTREAARLLDIPSGTVKTRLKRAKRIMREQLA